MSEDDLAEIIPNWADVVAEYALLPFVQTQTPYGLYVHGRRGSIFVVPLPLKTEPKMLQLAFDQIFPAELPTDQPSIDRIVKAAVYAFETEMNSYRRSTDQLVFLSRIRYGSTKTLKMISLTNSNPQPLKAMLNFITSRLAGVPDVCLFASVCLFLFRRYVCRTSKQPLARQR